VPWAHNLKRAATPRSCLRLPCSAFRQAAAKVSTAAPQSTPNVKHTAGKGRKSANGTAPTCFEVQKMATDGIWRPMAQAANIIGIIVALAALGLVGYFASLGLQLMRHGGG
jgi:hypothetical protein